MTTIAITGVGGFIGLRMVERARELGWEVRGVDVDPNGAKLAEDAGATTVVGDINDGELLEELFEGADIVFHTAAIVDETGDRDLFYRVNVEGTRSVCAAATAAGVHRLVHLSSVMVYGFDYPEGIDETFEVDEYFNIYCETKKVSEDEAFRFHEPGALEIIVIRPGDVYGARSRPWMLRPLETMEAGLFNLPGGGRGIVNHVHVDNLLDAVFLALEKDATGEVFNITDGVATACIEFFRYHAEMLGKKSVPCLPTGLLKGMLTVAGPVYRLRGKEPPATKEALNFLLRHSKISSKKARQTLGFEPRIDLKTGMAQVAEELRLAGRL